MPRIKPVEMHAVDAGTAATLNAVKSKLGVLPNIFTTFAQSPLMLNAYLQLSETLAGGQLNARQRELIAVAVAQENQCGYCLSAHTAIGKSSGLSQQDIDAARQGNAAAAADAAILDFALQVLDTNGDVADSQLATLRAAGINDAAILEIVGNVVLNIMTNYTNRLADTEIDFPFVSLESVA